VLYGKPVVAFRVGGIPEVVGDWYPLFPFGDVTAAAARLDECIESPILAREVAERSRDRAERSSPQTALSHSTKRYAEARQLFAEFVELPEKIRYTRNHLTHYTGNTDSPKYLKTAEMIKVNWYLRVFIWICLSKELGITGRSVERLIKRYGDAEFVNFS
jgi:hypothetical protein